MKTVAILAVLSSTLLMPIAAFAENSGGSRQVAGGGHMSTYVSDPNHDPHSVHSQRHSTGQILGAPMHSENAGAHRAGARSARAR